MFSRRTQHESEPNALTQALRKRRSRGLSVCDLTVSNPTLTGLPYVTERVLSALSQVQSLTYEPAAFGLQSAREAVSALHAESGLYVPTERIVLTSSTSEAYSYLFKLLCDAGDEVLIPRPSYPLFEHLATLEHVSAVNYALDYDGAWHVDFDSLERALTPRARAIVIVNPNNPTGSFLKRSELARLSSYGLPLISDEVFSSFPHVDDPQRAHSVLEGDAVLSFALGGLSKLAALPQMKLAWLCASGPSAAVEEALARLELIADTYLSPSTPVQLALPELLVTRAPVAAALRQRMARNLAVLDQALRGSAASALFLEGGWYVTLRLPAVHTESEWVLGLLEADGVLTQPGFFYDYLAGTQLVLSLITEEAQFALGIGRIAERVRHACV